MVTETADPCLSRHKGNEQSNEAWKRVDGTPLENVLADGINQVMSKIA